MDTAGAAGRAEAADDGGAWAAVAVCTCEQDDHVPKRADIPRADARWLQPAEPEPWLRPTQWPV